MMAKLIAEKHYLGNAVETILQTKNIISTGDLRNEQREKDRGLFSVQCR